MLFSSPPAPAIVSAVTTSLPGHVLGGQQRPVTLAEVAALHREHAVALAREVATTCLASAQVTAAQVGMVVTVNSTGFTIPSLDAHLANQLGLPSHVRRLPLTDLGGAGALTALRHARAFVRARPGRHALVVAVELPSLAWRAEHAEAAGWVARELARDAAAAALVSSDDRDGVRLLGGGSQLLSDQGRNSLPVDEHGLLAALLAGPPDAAVQAELGARARGVLDGLGIAARDLVNCWWAPGAPLLTAALAAELGLPPRMFAQAEELLRTRGHLSGVAPLFALTEALARRHTDRRPAFALVGALGPGPCAELAVWEL